jgi:hypothetical protein
MQFVEQITSFTSDAELLSCSGADEGVSKTFRTGSIKKYILTTIKTR